MGLDRPLAGKVALISGTAAGIGRAAALAFAAAGAKVFGCDVNAAGSDETIELVRAAGGTMRSLHPVDVSTPEGAKTWTTAAVEAFGGIDVLYNNAAVNHSRTSFPESTFEQWELALRYELTIVYTSSFAAWPHLIERGGGLIINVGSIAGHQELWPYRSAAHGTTKAAVIAFTRMLAADGAAHNIRAVSISPGVIHAPSKDWLLSAESPRAATGRALIGKVPMGRPGSVDEIASVAVFLASPSASYINATDILVDGGFMGVSWSSAP